MALMNQDGTNVIQLLQAASSQNVQNIAEAETHLKLLEVEPGFYSTLLEIFLTKNMDLNIRWMSILYFKNGINKYWRQRQQKCLSEEEKAVIRNKVISTFDEEIPQLALQLAVVVGKITRIDIKQWPQSIQQTIQVVRSENKLHQHRALLTLNHIVKELASKRLISDRKIFQEILHNIFDYLVELSDNALSLLSQSKVDDLENIILITKILRKLVVFGGKYTTESSQMRYLRLCLHRVSSMLSLKEQWQADIVLVGKSKRLLILYMKMLLETLENHVHSFVEVLEDTIKFCLQTILASDNNSTFPIFVIYTGNILRSITSSYSNKNQKTSSSEADQIPEVGCLIRDKILTEECVQYLCRYIILHYFPLTDHDLFEWKTDPEEYMIVEVGESHKFMLRPCMETLFVGLFYQFRNFIVPVIKNSVEETNKLDLSMMQEQDLLKLAAVYKAIGLGSYELFDDLDFDEWLKQRLLAQLRMSYQTLPVLQQHIIWLIGQWINVKFSNSNRISLYKLSCHMLTNISADSALKLTVCDMLKSAIDDFQFEVEDFSPFFSDLFAALCNFLESVELCDTKLRILNLLSIMIERSSGKVEINASLLLQYLPQLWQLSEEHNLLRGAVINVLVHLVQGLDYEGLQLSQIALPIVNFSICVEQPAHVYLLEDGLELLLAVLKSCSQMTSELLVVYKNIPALFERASETLDICLDITKLYIFLDPPAFLKLYSTNLSNVFTQLLGHIKEEATLKVAKILTLVLQLAPSRFQNHLLDILNFILKDDLYPPLMVEYISMFASTVLTNPGLFTQLLLNYCSTYGCCFHTIISRLIDVWLNKIDCMRLKDKKRSTLALCALLVHKIDAVFSRFALILDLCVNVMYDLQKENNGLNDSFVVSLDLLSMENYNSVEAKEHIFYAKDPIHTVVLQEHVRKTLHEVKHCYGEHIFDEAINMLDPVVAGQLKTLIN